MAKNKNETTETVQNEIEAVVEQTEDAQVAEAVAEVIAREFVEYSIAQAFDVPIDPEITITGVNEPGDHTPAFNEQFIIRKELLRDILAWWMIGENDGLLLSGPSGTGKTSIIRQICSILRLDVRQVTGHDRLEPQELITTVHIVDGNTYVLDGPLTYAMRYGQVFMLDEMDANLPSTNLALNDVIQNRSLTIPETGETVVAHENFKFIATGNTNGGGDMEARFHGTMEQNLAFMDRFWVMEVGYPDKDIEIEILKKVMPANTPDKFLGDMIDFANDVRAAFMGNSSDAAAIEVTMTTRTLVRWARMVAFFRATAGKGIKPIYYALERALANRANGESKEFIMTRARDYFG